MCLPASAVTDYVFYPASPLVTTKCVVISKYFDTCFPYNGEVEECCFVAVYSKKGERGLESADTGQPELGNLEKEPR